MRCINLWTLVLIGCTFSGANQLPSFIQRCKRNANTLERNKCIMARVDDVRSHLVEGIPGVKLPRIEPFRIPKLEANVGSGALGFTLIFTDTELFGVKHFNVTEFDLVLENNGHLFLHIYLPYLNCRTKYVAKGKIMLFELDATGMSTANISEINCKTSRKLSIATRGGKEYIQFDDDNNFKITYGSVSFYFDDLIKNNKELTEQTNKALNDNYGAISKEIDKLVSDGVYAAVFSIIQSFLEDYSLDELFE